MHLLGYFKASFMARCSSALGLPPSLNFLGGLLRVFFVHKAPIMKYSGSYRRCLSFWRGIRIPTEFVEDVGIARGLVQNHRIWARLCTGLEATWNKLGC